MIISDYKFQGAGVSNSGIFATVRLFGCGGESPAEPS